MNAPATTPAYPILLVGPDGRVVRASAAATRRFGPSVGRPCDEVVAARAPDGAALCGPCCARDLLAREASRDLRGLDGEGRPCRVSCCAFDDGIAVTVRDCPAVEPPKGRLTDREVEVLRLLATGMTMREIAASLGRGATTVRTHLDSARCKLRAETLPEVVARAADLGLLGR